MTHRKHGGLASVAGDTAPNTIDAFVQFITIDVRAHEVELVAHPNTDDPELAHPIKLRSRHPAVVAFHRELFEALQKRDAAAVARQDAPESTEAA